MINGKADDEFEALAARLTARAEAIGRGWGEQQVLDRRADPNRWRRADYLWPRFAKG